MIQINDVEFELLRKLLYGMSGIEVPGNKRYLFQTRLSAFLEENGFNCFSAFYNQLTHAKEGDLQEVSGSPLSLLQYMKFASELKRDSQWSI